METVTLSWVNEMGIGPMCIEMIWIKEEKGKWKEQKKKKGQMTKRGLDI